MTTAKMTTVLLGDGSSRWVIAEYFGQSIETGGLLTYEEDRQKQLDERPKIVAFPFSYDKVLLEECR